MKPIHRLMLNPLDIRDAMVTDRPKAPVSWPVHHDRLPQTGPDATPYDNTEEVFDELEFEMLMENVVEYRER